MQYSVVNYKTVLEDNELFRIDADFFRAYYLDSERKIKSHNWDYLGNLSKQIVNFGAYSLTNQITYLDEGVPFLNVGDIKDNDIDVENAKKIDEKLSREVLKKSLCKDDQVLLTIAGTIGNAAVAYNLPKNTNSNQAIANITLEKLSPFYLSVYLNSNFGKQQTARLTISSVQPNLLLTQVKKIKVFIPGESFQKLIENLYKKTYQIKETSKSHYSQAEQLLLSELGLLDWKLKHQLAFVKNFSDTQKAERIDAEYFQPKYEEIIEAVKKYKGGFDDLGNLVEIKDKNFTPKENEQYKYIELANISSNGEINGYTENFGNELPSRARRKVQKGDVIVSSIEGSLESIALITEDWKNALCSTGFFMVNSDKINSETLLVLLKTRVGQLQLKKGCKGTILTAISKDELSKIVLPKIEPETQEEIKKKIAEMYETKKLSKSLLEIAKQGVEMAIEKDEQEAEKWIENKLTELGIKI